jgi:hypothetical protein
MGYLAVSPLFAQSSYLRLVQQSYSVGTATEKDYSFQTRIDHDPYAGTKPGDSGNAL